MANLYVAATRVETRAEQTSSRLLTFTSDEWRRLSGLYGFIAVLPMLTRAASATRTSICSDPIPAERGLKRPQERDQMLAEGTIAPFKRMTLAQR